jgi:hypothetical protein
MGRDTRREPTEVQGSVDRFQEQAMGDMFIINTFALLLVGHALADYPLQGDFLSKAKNRFAPVVGVPWYQALGAHSLIHAGVVGLVTGSLVLGMLEFVAHSIIDDTKCRGGISYDVDQVLHVLCKLAWISILATGELS